MYRNQNEAGSESQEWRALMDMCKLNPQSLHYKHLNFNSQGWGSEEGEAGGLVG